MLTAIGKLGLRKKYEKAVRSEDEMDRDKGAEPFTTLLSTVPVTSPVARGLCDLLLVTIHPSLA